MGGLPVNWRKAPILSLQIRWGEHRLNVLQRRTERMFNSMGVRTTRQKREFRKELDRVFAIPEGVRGTAPKQRHHNYL